MVMSKKQVRKLVFKALLKEGLKDKIKEGLKDKNCESIQLPKWVNVWVADSTFYLLKTNEGSGRLTVDLDNNITLELQTRKRLCRIVL